MIGTKVNSGCELCNFFVINLNKIILVWQFKPRQGYSDLKFNGVESNGQMLLPGVYVITFEYVLYTSGDFECSYCSYQEIFDDKCSNCEFEIISHEITR